MENILVNSLTALIVSFGSASGVTIVVVIAVWLSRTSIEKFLDFQVERAKHTLSIVEIEHEIRFKSVLEHKESQLSEFYWPIYIRVQKDNATWDMIFKRYREQSKEKETIGREIEKNVILPNHDEIISIIENKIHLAEADEELEEAIRKYIRHVAVYKALRSAGIYDVHPLHVDEPWPKDFYPLIERKTKHLQREYESLLRTKDAMVKEETGYNMTK